LSKIACAATQSVWSASSLLALSEGRGGSKAGASSAHSKRFAQFGYGFAGLRHSASKHRKLTYCFNH
jgi:hypothetical protein